MKHCALPIQINARISSSRFKTDKMCDTSEQKSKTCIGDVQAKCRREKITAASLKQLVCLHIYIVIRW